MNVFVLGAGASADAGFPLGAHLTAVVRKWLPFEQDYGPLWEELERRGIFRANDDFELNLTRLDLEILAAQRRGEQATITVPGHPPFLLNTFRAWGLSEAIRAPLESRLEGVVKKPDEADLPAGFRSTARSRGGLPDHVQLRRTWFVPALVVVFSQSLGVLLFLEKGF